MDTNMKIKWNDSMAVWWSFAWRSTLYGFVAGAAFGVIAGGIAGATGHLDKAGQYGGLAGAIAGVGLSMFAMKQALEKHLARLSAIIAAPGNSPMP